MRSSGDLPATAVIAVIAAAVALLSSPARSEVPTLDPGATEIGLAWSWSSVEGNARFQGAVQGTHHRTLLSGLVGFGAEAGYAHVSAQDLLDLEGTVSWRFRAGRSALYPFFALGGGIRQEWLGSFSDVRVLFGADLGLSVLLSRGAAIRWLYRVRRVTDDPVAGTTEHRFQGGVSAVLGNAAP